MDRSDVLVIVPSYGHFDFVRRTVLSLKGSMGADASEADYVVVDDASSDWDSVDWDDFPEPHCRKVHFEDHSGLTRSWNHGLSLAKEGGYRYAICANSDVLFSPGSLKLLIAGLDAGFSLVGPLTNAPGHCSWQDVRPFLANEKVAIDDSPESLSEISKHLAPLAVNPIACPVNGFCLAALTETWWNGAYDSCLVFDPAFPLAGNEMELQNRWSRSGLRSAVVPRSYVFHYRSVSREAGLKGFAARGAFRPIVDMR